jgi:hypothetical protein
MGQVVRSTGGGGATKFRPVQGFVCQRTYKTRGRRLVSYSAAAEISWNYFWQELLPYEEEDATDADEKPTENRFVSDEERELTEVFQFISC